MFRISIICIFFIVPVFLFGQKYSGYIIDENDQKIEGTIHFKGFKNICQFVEFSKDSEITKYSPNSIKKCFINELWMYFESTNLKYYPKDNLYQNDGYDFVESRYEDEKIESNVFLIILADGDITLYKYIDDNSDTYFFVKKNTEELIQLKNLQYMDRNSGERIHIPEYQGVLKYLMQDSKKVLQKIDKLDYNENQLVDIVNTYNKSKTNVKIANDYDSNIRFGIIQGVNITKVSFLDIKSLVNSEYEYDRFTTYTPGLSIHLKNKFRSNSLFYSYDLLYAKEISIDKTMSSRTNAGISIERDANMNSSFLLHNFNIGFVLLTSKDINPFISGGLELGTSVGEVEFTESNADDSQTSIFLEEIKLRQFGYLIKFGIKRDLFNRLIHLSYKYNMSYCFMKSPELDAQIGSISTSSILLRFYF